MKYVFDLDGTLCTQEKSGEYHLAIPVWPMIHKLNELYDAGHEITIFTARGMNTYQDENKAIARYSEMTRDWLVDHGVKFHNFIMGKPPADVYVDDKAMTPDEFLNG